MPRTHRSPIDRFWFYANKKSTSECWNWIGGRAGGYGNFHPIRTKSERAHRYSWMLHHGPIPKGLLVCHHCDNPICVNPSHLFLGTHKTNAEDMMRKGRHKAKRGEAASHAKLTNAQVLEIRRRYAPHNHATADFGRGNGGELAREYGITNSAISAIVRRKSWKHLP